MNYSRCVWDQNIKKNYILFKLLLKKTRKKTTKIDTEVVESVKIKEKHLLYIPPHHYLHLSLSIQAAFAVCCCTNIPDHMYMHIPCLKMNTMQLEKPGGNYGCLMANDVLN